MLTYLLGWPLVWLWIWSSGRATNKTDDRAFLWASVCYCLGWPVWLLLDMVILLTRQLSNVRSGGTTAASALLARARTPSGTG